MTLFSEGMSTDPEHSMNTFTVLTLRQRPPNPHLVTTWKLAEAQTGITSLRDTCTGWIISLMCGLGQPV